MAEKPEKRLLIIGTATNHGDAPYDSDATVWGTGGVIVLPKVKRVDAMFELHPARYWKLPQVLEQISKFPGIVYMMDKQEEVPTSVRYPIEDVKKAFYIPTMGTSLYITNTVSFMLALAYLEGYTHIDTYGVYMEHESEYGYQKPNCEYFLGFLHAKGVEVNTHGGEVLKAKFLYGYEEPGNLMQLIEDEAALENGRKEYEREIANNQQAMWKQEGAILYVKDQRKKLGGY